MVVLFVLLLTAFIAVVPVHGQSRTTPPTGAIVVKPSGATSGQFTSVSAAINSLPQDSNTQTIFIYSGTYEEQVSIDRPGAVKIYGYTTNVQNYADNTVSIVNSASLAMAGSDDLTGTFRIHSNNVALYNIDIHNNFGVAASNGQALALSNYGNQVGVYASRLYSYQDTLLAETGAQVYLKSYIEGAVDFIFGQTGQAYFEGNVIASKGAGCITASGRSTDDNTMYLFNQNQLLAASDAFSNVTGNVYLGRPWSDYAKVIFLNTYIGSQLNKNLWSIWNTATPNTDHVTFADYNSTGPGVTGATRPSFATELTSSQASAYTISAALGSDYLNWVDTSYLMS